MIRGSKEYWTLFVLMLITYSIYHAIVFLIRERKKAKNRAYNKQQEELEKRQVVDKEKTGVVFDIEAEERKKHSIISHQIQGFKEIPYQSEAASSYSFNCINCGQSNEVIISFIERGDSQYGLAQLVYRYEAISKYDIYDWQLADSRSDIPGSFYVGTNHAIGKLIACSNCEEIYFMVFSSGEQQPSRYSTFINGVWQVRKTSELVD